MNTVVCNEYGTPDVLKVVQTQKPSPKKDEVLVRVYASSVTAADTMLRRGVPIYARLFLGLLKPKLSIPGTGFSGVIERLGESVNEYVIGDQVFGEVIFTPNCFASGTNADYVCVNTKQLILHKPSNLSHVEAASICDGLVTSLNFLTRVAQIKPGQRVLVNGASGSLGTAAVQLVKSLGAQVTALSSQKNHNLVRSLGADRVVDYRTDCFKRKLGQYDVIYDTVGSLHFRDYKPYLSESGVFLSPKLSLRLLWNMLCTATSKKKALFSATGLLEPAERHALFEHAVRLLVKKEVRQVIDQTFDINDIAAAHRYIETGRKVGNVALVSLTE